jgi:protein-L-isoaspartate O-methyltransferase
VTSTLDWAVVMAEVSRERFIPDRIWRHDPNRVGHDLVPVERHSDPDRWAAMVAADEPIITQVDNGHPAEDGTGLEATSSCSDRRVVLEMLHLLAPEPGAHVLEIGTGTGWSAALLAGAGAQVSSVEIDGELANHARERLISNGFRDVTVIHADATTIALTDFDAVLASVGVREVPFPWVMHTRGRLVVPLTNAWYPPGISVLNRTGDHSASGRLAGPANFMSIRAEATSRIRTNNLVATHIGCTDIHPYYLTGDRDAAVAIGQRTRGITFAWRPAGESADGTLWLYSSCSWASIETSNSNGAPYEVAQAGPRRLVDEVLAAYEWWQQVGEPRTRDWRVTVTPQGQRIELDTTEPDNA